VDKAKIIQFLNKVSTQAFVNVQAFASCRDNEDDQFLSKSMMDKVEENREIFKGANSLIKELENDN
jgi:hypothetical protein